MTPGYLYIAKDPACPHQLKVGYTTDTPAVRRGQLPVHTATALQVLRAFPTKAPEQAQSLAYQQLAGKQLCVSPTVTDQFVDKLALIATICARAAEDANIHALSQVEQPLASVPSDAHCLVHDNPAWAALLELPVLLTRGFVPLGGLMVQALTDRGVADTLRLRFGMECVAKSSTEVQVGITWAKAAALSAWLSRAGYGTPPVAATTIEFTLTAPAVSS